MKNCHLSHSYLWLIYLLADFTANLFLLFKKTTLPILEQLYQLYLLTFYKPANFLSVGNRRHPSPTKEMLEPLLRTASSVGLNLDVSSSKALAESLDNAKVKLSCIILVSGCFTLDDNRLYANPLLLHDMQRDDPYFNKLIRILATRCMTQVR